MKRSYPVALAIALLGGIGQANADESDKISYWKDVRPIFQAQCHGCHQPAKTSGDYIMTDFAALAVGGESGDAAIVPGSAEESYLVQQITPVDDVAAMPQDQPPLSDEQVALIRGWIDQGAIDDTPASARQQYDAQHPPQYKAAPVVTSLAFTPDGQQLAVSGYHEVLIHDVQKLLAMQTKTPQPETPPADAPATLVARLIGMSERIESVAISPDGTRLAMVGGSPGRLGELQIWDLTTHELQLSVSVSYDTCYGASWSHDNKLVALGCPDNTVRAFDAVTGQQVLFNGAHNDWVLDTVFSVDSTHLVTVSRDRSMKLIHVPTERFVDNVTSITPGALKGGLNTVDRHPTEDQLLIGGADGVPKTYKMFREQARRIGDDFNLIRKYPEMPGRIFACAYRPDGRQIVAGSSYNGAGHVHLFDTETGERVYELSGIDSAIYCVAFSPDGKLIASGGFGGEVYLHATDTGKLRVAFTPIPQDRP